MKVVSRFTDPTRQVKEFGLQVGETDTGIAVQWIDLTEETDEELRSMYTSTTSRDFQDAILTELRKRQGATA